MGRQWRGRPVCETCLYIDVRRWRREGKLSEGEAFECSWTSDGKPCGSIRAQTEEKSVVLMFRSLQDDGGWASIQQRVPITWSRCRLGGRRPWFLCDVKTIRQCRGRRVAIIYSTGGLFACRACHGLSYGSQREPLRHRGLAKARKIRAHLGGSANMFDPFPDRPRGMHRRTYFRLRQLHDAAAARLGF
jgi:hypothetical protein